MRSCCSVTTPFHPPLCDYGRENQNPDPAPQIDEQRGNRRSQRRHDRFGDCRVAKPLSGHPGKIARRRRCCATFRQCLCERRGHSFLAGPANSGQGWRRGQHHPGDCRRLVRASHPRTTNTLHLMPPGLKKTKSTVAPDNVQPQKTRLWLMYPPKLIPSPVIWELGRKFKVVTRSEEHTSELQSQSNLVCRLLL